MTRVKFERGRIAGEFANLSASLDKPKPSAVSRPHWRDMTREDAERHLEELSARFVSEPPASLSPYLRAKLNPGERESA